MAVEEYHMHECHTLLLNYDATHICKETLYLQNII